MIDESHPAFSHPDHLERDMRRLYESLRGTVDAGGASGTFTSTADRMQGHVITRRTIIGVWADRNGKDRISGAVFYQVNGGKVRVDEFSDVDWSYWDLVEKARDWAASE